LGLKRGGDSEYNRKIGACYSLKIDSLAMRRGRAIATATRDARRARG